MTPADARKILGLGSDEDPRPLLAKLNAAREHLAAMVREAANDTIADRYQSELMEFDQALAAIRESMEDQAPAESPAPQRSTSRAPFFIALVAILIGASLGGGWMYLEKQRNEENQRLTRIQFLDRQASILIENRRWDDAAKALEEIETLSPQSDLVLRGRRSIENGIAEEQTQFISYWTGVATAELDAGKFDEAIAAARQVLDKFPNESQAQAIITRAETTRQLQLHTARIDAARELLHQRKWDESISSAKQILKTHPGDPAATALLAEASAGRDRFLADQAKAAALIEMALARDQGTFDPQALDWLREAKILAPEHPDVDRLLEKFSAYTRTLRVPCDFATPAEAIAGSRPRDRIVLAAESWKGPLVIPHALELEGAGPDQTRIACPAEAGNAIIIHPAATGVRISGIGFRHETPLALGAERFSVAVLQGGGATFVDCHFTEAGGHGLAVIEGGKAEIIRCRFADNAWNGIAAIGKGTAIEVKECESLNNFENGIESWADAAATVTQSRCEGNSRNGIHADNGASTAVINGNQFIANREFGLVLGSAGSGNISENIARANLLGGFVIRHAAASLPVTGNTATLNEGPGLTLEKGLEAASYADNSLDGNTGQAILTGLELTPPDPAPPQPE